MIPIVEQAGGIFTDLSGPLDNGTSAGLFSNANLSDQILHAIRSP